MFKYKKTISLFICLLLIAAGYIGGRLYFHFTGGFLVSNIHHDLPFENKWEVSALTAEAQEQLDKVLSQPFYYLSKGCQSYVFVSKDEQYVIKFFKYQRFRPSQWVNLFSFIPSVGKYRDKKAIEKKERLDNVFTSCKWAYEYLRPQTGLLFVHLNKTPLTHSQLTIYDKLGLKHVLDLNKVEFLVQKKADLLCPTLQSLVDNGHVLEAKLLLTALVKTLESEYKLGFADNDHALMQNTGVIDGKPIHIDVGQFVKNPIVQDPQVYKQELFNKTYRFRTWLKGNFPTLAVHIDRDLYKIIGEDFYQLKPIFYTADMSRIPNA